MSGSESNGFGRILRQRRVMIPLTLQKLAKMSGVSSSHLGRIERNERFPSAAILKKIAKPLGFEEEELFILAGYLSPQPDTIAEAQPSYNSYNNGRLDPYVANLLAQEPVEMQHAVLSILSILKNVTRIKR
jgi:transcriptional regulator with XRE-family HTH domain